MLDRFMAKIGKGAADVYLQLPEDTFHLGEKVQGNVIVKGGKVEQRINKIQLELYQGYSEFTMGEQLLISTVPVVKEGFKIKTNEIKTFPFTFNLPTSLDWDDQHEFYFVTKLDIDAGKDDRQKTVITLLPSSVK